MTRRQAYCVLVMFNFGSSVVMGVSTGVAQDAWISLLFATLFSMPLMLLYARIAALNPGVDLFTAIEAQLGKAIGKIAVALMTWYALHLCALVLRNFSEFIQISSLLETPQLAVLVVMLITVSYLAKYGGKALGKWSLATVPIILFIVVLTVTLSLNVMHFEHILPVLEHSPMKIARDAFQILSFPFAETVLFLGVADLIAKTDSPRRIYLGATLFSSFVLLIIILRNLFVLGPAVVSVEYFPSYAAARIINLSDFLSRIEGSISVNFMLAGITKITLCLIVASRGVAKLFGIPDWRHMVLPMGLTAVMLATILYKNTMEMFIFVKYYAIYATPFQIIVPALIWIVSERRARRARGAGRGA